MDGGGKPPLAAGCCGSRPHQAPVAQDSTKGWAGLSVRRGTHDYEAWSGNCLERREAPASAQQAARTPKASGELKLDESSDS